MIIYHFWMNFWISQNNICVSWIFVSFLISTTTRIDFFFVLFLFPMFCFGRQMMIGDSFFFVSEVFFCLCWRWTNVENRNLSKLFPIYACSRNRFTFLDAVRGNRFPFYFLFLWLVWLQFCLEVRIGAGIGMSNSFFVFFFFRMD